MVYGYARKTLTDEGLLEMKEVTFSTCPEALRALAAFLNEMADELDKGPHHFNWHRHMSFRSAEWKRFEPSTDVVVSVPKEDGD